MLHQLKTVSRHTDVEEALAKRHAQYKSTRQQASAQEAPARRSGRGAAQKEAELPIGGDCDARIQFDTRAIWTAEDRHRFTAQIAGSPGRRLRPETGPDMKARTSTEPEK